MPEKSVSCSTVLWNIALHHYAHGPCYSNQISGEFPLTWHVWWGGKNMREKRKTNIKKIQAEWRNECRNTTTLSFSSMETLPKYVEILCWNSCFENKQRGGTGGLRLPLFRCGMIMMIKSQLQSYSKQWYAHSWGDSQSAGFPGSFFTLSHF